MLSLVKIAKPVPVLAKSLIGRISQTADVTSSFSCVRVCVCVCVHMHLLTALAADETPILLDGQMSADLSLS